MKMRLSKMVVAVLATSALAACSVSNERWSNFDNQPLHLSPQENQAGLVFYRTDAGVNPTAVTVSVNGEYLSSLQSGGFSQVYVCAKPAAINAAYVAQDRTYEMKKTAMHNITLANQSVHYFAVSSNQMNKPQLTEVDEATAQEALKTLKHQANTISRVSNACATR